MIHNFLKAIAEANTLQWIILLSFAALYLIRLFFLILFLLRIIVTKNASFADAKIPVSLLMTIRNEEENIKRNLTKILSIGNVDYEVIVVDDFSQDNSLSLLGILKNQHKNLKVSALTQETRFSEKLSQNIAIKASDNEWVLFVTASIDSFEENWLGKISGLMHPNINTVVNYSNVKRGGWFFNHIYRIERFMQQIKSAGYILNGLPFVYFDENVAFKKEKYFEIGGYGKRIKEPYANLELLINSFLQKRNTKISFTRETAVWEEQKITRPDYFDLIKKSFRIEKYLSGVKKFVLWLDSVTKLLYIPALIVIIALMTNIWIVVSVLVFVQFLGRLFIIKTLTNRLNEHKIFLSSLVYDLIIPYFKLFFKWYFNRRSRSQ